MVRDKLKKYLSDRGLSEVNLHSDSMELFASIDGAAASLIYIISGEMVGSINSEALNRYHEKIRGNYINSGYQMVNILTLFITGDLQAVKALDCKTPFWIIDEKYGRLVIYENQPEDYLGIRLFIEKEISMYTAEKLKEADEVKRKLEEQERLRAYEQSIVNNPKRRVNREGITIIKQKPVITISLVAINIFLLIIVNLFGVKLGISDWLDLGANSWMETYEGGEWYRLITATFLHSGVDHLFGNMIMLYAAGELLEAVIGHIRFFLLYIIGGISASLGSMFYYYNSEQLVQSIGASGAVFAVMGGLLGYFVMHRERINEIGGARLLLMVILALYSGFVGENVDNAAHICGLIAGLVVYLIYYFLEILCGFGSKNGKRIG